MQKKLILINKNKHGFGLSEQAHVLFLKKAKLCFHLYKDSFRQTCILKCSPSMYERDIARAHMEGPMAAEQMRRHLTRHVAEIPRDHPVLLEVFNELGLEGMNDTFSDLHFAEVAEDAAWNIKVIDGKEYISISTS